MKPSNLTIRTALAAALSLGLFAAIPLTASADTVGYWRFEENGTNIDASGNSNNLTTVPTAYDLTATTSGDPGDRFFDIVTDADLPNEQAANLGDKAEHYQTTSTAYLSTDFTVETFAHLAPSAQAGNFYLISKYTSPGSRMWGLRVNNGDNKLMFIISTDGTNPQFIDPNITINTGSDYYIAVSHELGDGVSDSVVTFHYRNLSEPNSVLETVVVNTPLLMYTGGSGVMEIGTLANGASNRWSGLLDEVRYSTGVLDESELLGIPEPSGLGMILLGGMTVLRHRAR